MDEQLPEDTDIIVEALWDERFKTGVTLRRQPRKKPNRRDQVRRNIEEVFELLGGVPRLAHWANQNYGLFVTKSYMKMLDQQNTLANITNNTQVIWQQSIPPSDLDAYPQEALESSPTPTPTPPPDNLTDDNSEGSPDADS